jgi:pyrimidine operon attenuation protein / uracil phosphoribosyltransferase
MRILSDSDVKTIIKRLSVQILESHLYDEDCFLLGINTKGYHIASLIHQELESRKRGVFHLISISINPANPILSPIEIAYPVEKLQGAKIILVDDVANTGRTLWYAAKPLFTILPNSIEALVLVDRTHKKFPMHVNYVGKSLATTAQDNIELILDGNTMEAFLE